MTGPEPVVYRGRYALQQSIGKGGMAEVFLAQDQLLDRPVAVKRLPAEHAGDPSFVERFRREAQAAAKLNHPNIVGVFDYFEEGGEYFIVQEYIDGRSLAELLRAEGRLHPDRAADIAADIAAGLGAAHREGMVHRDVKAGNVLVATDGQVKVADFGIARVFAGGDSELTQAGTVMGTATYFSPEQAQGKPVDPRSDLYSLGVVLYEMLVGHARRSPATSPWPSPTPTSTRRPRGLREVDPELPLEIDAITMKLLAKDPANRYPSADDLRADLRRFREGAKLTPTPAPAAVAAAAVRAAAPGGRLRLLRGRSLRRAAPPDRLLPALHDPGVRRRRPAASTTCRSSWTSRTTPPRSRCPTWSGRTASGRVGTCRRAGFQVQVQEEASAEIARRRCHPPGPRARTEPTEGSVVTIVVSVGAESRGRPRRPGPGHLHRHPGAGRPRASTSSRSRPRTPRALRARARSGSRPRPPGPRRLVGSSVLIRVVPVETTTTSPVIVTQAPPPPTSPPATSPPPTSPPPTTPPTTP